MATVWAAEFQPSPGEFMEVVLKILHPEVRKDPERRNMFLEEARISILLDHPYVVKTYAIEHCEDLDFLVMERVWGVSLDLLLAQTKKFSPAQPQIPWPIAISIAAMAADALHYANNMITSQARSLSLIHRDIKPANILLTTTGDVRIIDFGIAKASTSQIKTQTGIVKGTIAYMSPEQLRAEPLDIRSDLYSLGAVLYELCLSKRPFRGNNITALMLSILNHALNPIRQEAPYLPEPLCQIIEQLLNLDRTQRPASGQILARKLEQILATESSSTSSDDMQTYCQQLFPELCEAWLHRKPSPERHLFAAAQVLASEVAQQLEQTPIRQPYSQTQHFGTDSTHPNQQFVLPPHNYRRDIAYPPPPAMPQPADYTHAHLAELQAKWLSIDQSADPSEATILDNYTPPISAVRPAALAHTIEPHNPQAKSALPQGTFPPNLAQSNLRLSPRLAHTLDPDEEIPSEILVQIAKDYSQVHLNVEQQTLHTPEQFADLASELAKSYSAINAPKADNTHNYLEHPTATEMRNSAVIVESNTPTDPLPAHKVYPQTEIELSCFMPHPQAYQLLNSPNAQGFERVVSSTLPSKADPPYSHTLPSSQLKPSVYIAQNVCENPTLQSIDERQASYQPNRPIYFTRYLLIFVPILLAFALVLLWLSLR
jgi:serine/threonine protein kinase